MVTATSVVGVMKMGNIVPRARIEPKSLAFRDRKPHNHIGSLMLSLYPHLPVYAAPCLGGQCRLLHKYMCVYHCLYTCIYIWLCTYLFVTRLCKSVLDRPIQWLEHTELRFIAFKYHIFAEPRRTLSYTSYASSKRSYVYIDKVMIFEIY